MKRKGNVELDMDYVHTELVSMVMFFTCVIWLESQSSITQIIEKLKRPSLIQKDITVCIPFRWNVFEMTTRTCDFATGLFYIEAESLQSLCVPLVFNKHVHKTRTKPRCTLGLVVLVGATDLNCLQPFCGTPKMNYQYNFKFSGRNPLIYPRYLKSQPYVSCAAFGAGWNQIWGSKSPIWWVVSSMTIEFFGFYGWLTLVG